MSDQVIVVGAGYAGCMAANRLQATGGAQVTVINPRPEFVERIRLHQVVAGTGNATHDLVSILHPDVTVISGSVQRIDASLRRVVLDDGTVRGYDHLVYAVGSRGGVVDIAGAAEHAYPMAELEDSARLAERLAIAPADAAIVVVGGGLTGVEVAAELAESRPKAAVSLVSSGAIVPSAGRMGHRSVGRRLKRLGVRIHENARVDAVSEQHVHLANGTALDSDITVWTAGFGVPELASISGLTTDDIGRLRVDRCLVSLDDPHIVGAGDAVTISETPLRMSCQMALPLGAQAAGAVISSLRDEPRRPADQGYFWQAIGLGRKSGTIVKTDRTDRPGHLYIGGRAGGLLKEQVCQMTVRWIRDEARKGGSYSWPHGVR